VAVSLFLTNIKFFYTAQQMLKGEKAVILGGE